ncbi:calcium-translocating P-type ATPase, PMCA-type [Phocaeicola barnesiae]|jgi:Ca2+-transporting ATPase|uniref:P-type Ca(2+) transporter n=1 Tax=Phocaeicola barnesiae TaxID=376804 RepID=A0AAW5N4H0_9BACT|nr:calcium-translocating P-type ATPase, PMCA-type [Phocaeicola barnesiae]MCR8874082.1 calcium-translocating P-type ATPase, PMCA-type [Phocaeicola barnesiae]MDM8257656.1 calcium-translocating P-type ATPase, PMCA-type [Phocaeicola barnesiae]
MSQTNPEPKLTGLTDQEVLSSREKYGVNLLTPPKRPSMWKLYLEKFQDPVIRVLLVAAFFSLIISIIENEYAETIGIFFAIFLATGIGFYFEYDANKKFDLLNAVGEETPVTVIRNGKIHEIPRKDIVVGDIVILNTGEEVPADGTLLEAVSLQINESSLTGELMVNKTVDEAHFDEEATYPSNTVMRGTTVTDGHGIMRVDKVGDATEIGKVARQATEQSEEQTPLNIQLTKLANLIGKAGFTIAALTFIIFTSKDLYAYFTSGAYTGDWHSWLAIARIVLKYFMMAVTLIVVAVPEGLPMSVTLSLALNMRRMLKTNNLVRKMHACETMGAITVICTDKTGTLTQNLMQVYEAQVDNSQPDLVAEGIAVNSTAFLEEKAAGEKPSGVGNPTEIALLLWLNGQGKDYMSLRTQAKVVNQLTFSTERKYMATLVDSPVRQKRILYIKGAPEIVMSKCNLPADAIARYNEQLLAYQNKAMRTLGIAYREIAEGESSDCATLVNEGGLTFQGIFAISDPIRPDVPDAVKKCQSAGIGVKIVTGDTPGTATEIARQIGLWQPEDTERNRITGVEFAALSDEEALDRVLDLKVMSRARPMDKQRLVQLLQQKGAVVAVTGDGTNDAPALNHAQVGLSMGTGTSVAKEASDITLLDDSFHSIATAVMWGRSLYKNIQRFIVFQLTINVVALLSVLLGAFFGTELPLTVTQMLWVNLIMDTFAAMALASISPSMDVMNEKPRKRTDFIITPAMRNNILGVGLGFLVILMGLLAYFKTLPGGMDVHHLTVFFTIFVMLQFWNLFNASVFGTNHSIFKDASHALGMLSVALIILVGQFLIVTFGGKVFRTEPLPLMEWLYIIGGTSIVLWIGEIWRGIQRLKKN